jgi:DNA-binding MarR family transcriptional regulator
MNKYFMPKQVMPKFLPYPEFLLKSDLNLAARETYALLLHRTTLSQLNGWTDENDRVFVIYPIAELAKDLGCCEMTVKRALKALDDADLIERRRVGFDKANLIFPKLPTEQF